MRGDSGAHNSADCHDAGSLAPIVMRRFEGVTYCGRRGSESLTDMVRPVKVDSTQTYACPQGYVACNSNFFSQPNGANYVVCKKSDSFNEVDCPITSVKFSVTEAERKKYDY